MLHHINAVHSTTSRLARLILVSNIALILQYQFEKPVLTVALTTVGAKSAVVDILMGMTATADFGGSPRIAAGLVTAIACQITVCTQQGIAGLFFVIELPHIPGVRRVA